MARLFSDFSKVDYFIIWPFLRNIAESINFELEKNLAQQLA